MPSMNLRTILRGTARNSDTDYDVNVIGSKAYIRARGFRPMTLRELVTSRSGLPRKFYIGRISKILRTSSRLPVPRLGGTEGSSRVAKNLSGPKGG